MAMGCQLLARLREDIDQTAQSRECLKREGVIDKGRQEYEEGWPGPREYGMLDMPGGLSVVGRQRSSNAGKWIVGWRVYAVGMNRRGAMRMEEWKLESGEWLQQGDLAVRWQRDNAWGAKLRDWTAQTKLGVGASCVHVVRARIPFIMRRHAHAYCTVNFDVAHASQSSQVYVY
ncbi:hypothetical protein BC835DRAFT_1309674 [Cytidiella melzeri]|nr:hypothetical protein BC835DRAFT_1309674 [Cytidiella melzeri]